VRCCRRENTSAMDIAPPEGAQRLPRGVADPGGIAGYVCSADGIERLDLRSGDRVWATTVAKYPVGLWRARLIALRAAAQSPALQIVTLDLERPDNPLVSSGPITVPAWAAAAPDRLFIEASIEGDQLILVWTSQKAYEGGAPPPRDIELAAARAAAGAARIDLTSGEVEVTTTRPSRARAGSAELSQLRNGEWYSDRWMAGPEAVRTVLTEVEGGQRLSLEFGADDAAGERVVVMEGTALVSVVTLDGAHVIARDEGRARAARNAIVFSIPARARVGAITWEPEASDPSVLGNRVVYLVRRVERAATAQSLGAVALALCARALQDDRVLWEHQLERVQTGPRQVRPRM
ncbi:MAG: hypothetical protein ACRD1U_09035, partial [Vicinamibacterales bacterium]